MNIKYKPYSRDWFYKYAWKKIKKFKTKQNKQKHPPKNHCNSKKKINKKKINSFSIHSTAYDIFCANGFHTSYIYIFFISRRFSAKSHSIITIFNTFFKKDIYLSEQFYEKFWTVTDVVAIPMKIIKRVCSRFLVHIYDHISLLCKQCPGHVFLYILKIPNECKKNMYC